MSNRVNNRQVYTTMIMYLICLEIYLLAINGNHKITAGVQATGEYFYFWDLEFEKGSHVVVAYPFFDEVLCLSDLLVDNHLKYRLLN